ncbi:MAG: lysophospholipid acyltransferase family protein [Deltaproteobacteria bacterium]|nr:MAG: lysophospholipid acyltransferase family protein [Deltaproteobacteria bacterium]
MEKNRDKVQPIRKPFRIRDFAHETFMARLIRRLVVPITRVWFGSCKVEVLNEELFEKYVRLDVPVVGGTWHRAAIFFLYYFGRFRPMIMISQSKDGEMLAQYTAGHGAIPVRGSSSRGGRYALERMVRHLKSGGKACATVLDGPRGPACVAKKGMIILAKLSGAPLVPVMWSASRTITLRHSWDKTVLPLPFSKVCVDVGEPIHVPADAKGEELEHYRRLVEERLNTMMAEVDRRCGYRCQS